MKNCQVKRIDRGSDSKIVILYKQDFVESPPSFFMYRKYDIIVSVIDIVKVAKEGE